MKNRMFGFKFITFAYGTNQFKCKECGHVIFASNPSTFVELAKEHRETCMPAKTTSTLRNTSKLKDK